MRTRIVAALSTALLVTIGLFAGNVSPASANNVKCDDLGYTKFDSSSGSETLPWGTLTWSGQSLTYTLGPGWTVDLCIKSGSAAGTSTYLDLTGSSPEPLTISQGISHIGYKDPTHANGLTCDAATLYKATPLTNGDHINIDVVIGGVKQQVNASVDIAQKPPQDPASESGLVVRLHLPSGDVTLPLTDAQVKSGILAFSYSNGWTGTWAVEWVQYNSSYFNQNRSEANFLHCAKGLPIEIQVAPSATRPTCSADGKLVLPATDHITWSGGVNGAGPDTYTIKAKPASGYTLNGAQDTWVIQVLPKGTGLNCGPPACIASSAVTYTYDAATNSGTVTVPNPVGSSGKLCNGFWVTAVSWKYAGSGVWPQNLDQNNPMPEKNGAFYVDEPGTYSYGATVSCGQGDIYASYDAQPVPTAVLNGPNNPYAEHFLHDMGFSGPRPTYMQSPTGCNKAIPVAPTATPITACDTDGVLSYGPTNGVVYSLTTGNSTSGLWEVTAVPATNYYFEGPQVVKFAGDLGAHTICAEARMPDITPAVCNPTTGAVTSAFVIIPKIDGFTYRIDGDSYEAGTKVELGAGPHVATAQTVAGYTNTGESKWNLEVANVADCDDPVEYVAPIITPEICDAPTGDVKGASVLFEETLHLTYFLDGTEVVFPAGETTVSLPVTVGAHTITAKTDVGYYIKGTAQLTEKDYPVTVETPATCDDPVKYLEPKVTPETCDAVVGGIKDGVVAFERVPSHLDYVFNGVTVDADHLVFTLPAGTYDLEVTAGTGYYIKGAGTTATYPITIGDPGKDCDEITVIPLDPFPTHEECVAGSLTGEKTQGAITIVKAAHVTWEISNDLDGVKHAVDTSGAGPNFVFPLPAGKYHVWATPDTGYLIATPHSFPLAIHEPELPCSLVDHAELPTSASWTNQVCATGGLVNPTITVVPVDGATYFIDGKPVTQTTTTVQPGTHLLTAAADDPVNNTVTQSSWPPLVLTASVAVCGDLTTLALTGGTPWGWLILAVLLLQAGFVLVAIRFVRSHQTARRHAT